MKGKPISQNEVLAWLKQNYPELWGRAEIDRAWIWIVADLYEPKYEATRKALNDFGFRCSRKGHQLASGRIGRWGHSCLRPMPLKRRGGRAGVVRNGSNGPSRFGAPASEQGAEPVLNEAEIFAALEALV